MLKGGISQLALYGGGMIVVGLIVASTSVTLVQEGAGEHMSGLDRIIGGLTGQATIGGETDDPEVAREQFRQLTAFNMMAAQQCEFVAVMAQADERDSIMELLEDEDPDDIDVEEYMRQIPRNLGDAPPSSEIKSLAQVYDENEELDSGDAFILWLTQETDVNPFYRVSETGYHGQCFGARLNIDVIGTIIDQSVVLSTIDDVASYLNRYDDHPFMGSDFDGGDMAGPPGRVTFDIQQNFTLNDPRLVGVSFGEDYKGDTGFIAGSDDDGRPTFWAGQRASLFVPSGIDHSEIHADRDLSSAKKMINLRGAEDITEWSEGLGVADDKYPLDEEIWEDNQVLSPEIRGNLNFRWDGVSEMITEGTKDVERQFLRSRVRVKDVPRFSTISLDWASKGRSYDPSTLLDDFVANSNYAFCSTDGEPMEGYIQTNTGDPGNSGAASHEDHGSPLWRDAAFPFVKVENSPIRTQWDQIDCVDIPDEFFVTGRNPNTGYGEGQGVGHLGTEFPLYQQDSGQYQLKKGRCKEDHYEKYVSFSDEGIEHEGYDEIWKADGPLGYTDSGERVDIEITCAFVVRTLQDIGNDIGMDASWGSDVWTYNLERVKMPKKKSGEDQCYEKDAYDLSEIGEISEGSLESNNDATVDLEGGNLIEYNLERFDRESTFRGAINMKNLEETQFASFLLNFENREEDIGIRIASNTGPVVYDEASLKEDEGLEWDGEPIGGLMIGEHEMDYGEGTDFDRLLFAYNSETGFLGIGVLEEEESRNDEGINREKYSEHGGGDWESWVSDTDDLDYWNFRHVPWITNNPDHGFIQEWEGSEPGFLPEDDEIELHGDKDHLLVFEELEEDLGHLKNVKVGTTNEQNEVSLMAEGQPIGC